MKILYFSFVELDIPNACQTHTLGVLAGFSNNLCKVDAIVPRPKKVRSKISGVRFYYLWPWRFSCLGKLWVKIIGAVVFFGLCLLKKYDAIYIRELEVNPFPRWCSMVFRIPFYIEINSILLKNMKMAGADNHHILRAEKHQTADFMHAKGLIVPSFPRCRWIIDHYGLDPEKVHLIMNGSDEVIKEKIKRSEALKNLNLPENGFYLGFLGTIWECYDLYGILKAIEICQEQIPDLYLLMIGDGPEINTFKDQSKLMAVDSKIIFLGYIQPEFLFKIIGVLDVGLMNMTREGLKYGGPVTSRFATYAAFELPVIANSVYMKNYPKELRQGLSLVPPENPQALADMMVWLYHNPEERKKKGRILYSFVTKKLTWAEVTREILTIIELDKGRSQFQRQG